MVPFQNGFSSSTRQHSNSFNRHFNISQPWIVIGNIYTFYGLIIFLHGLNVDHHRALFLVSEENRISNQQQQTCHFPQLPPSRGPLLQRRQRQMTAFSDKLRQIMVFSDKLRQITTFMSNILDTTRRTGTSSSTTTSRAIVSSTYRLVQSSWFSQKNDSFRRSLSFCIHFRSGFLWEGWSAGSNQTQLTELSINR